jgi:hypothetical protein
VGEFEVGVFWGFGRGSTWGWEEGGHLVFLKRFEGQLGVL